MRRARLPRLVLTPCFLSSSFKGAKLHFFPNMQLYHLQREESVSAASASANYRAEIKRAQADFGERLKHEKKKKNMRKEKQA